MNVRNCRKCGRLYNYVSGSFICPRCKEELEVKFQEVKLYIRENPGVGVKEVSEACEVETNQIYQWLREERLEVTEGSAIALTCESCGKTIRSGKYCENCKRDLATDLKKAMGQKVVQVTPNKKDAGSKMRYLERE